MTIRLLLVVGLLLGFNSQGQGLQFAFYNVENLFHPSWDSLNPDREFTPEGSKQWDTAKYYHKLNRLSKVILSMSDSAFEAPNLIAFAEVESAQVLSDLIRRPALAKIDYQWVHYDSPDRRGIDIGLIYRKDRLRLIESQPIAYKNPKDTAYTSRDMLFTKFSSLQNPRDTFTIIACHWPSRYGGKEKSEPRRLAAAEILVQLLENTLNAHSKLILMGDFNDEPQDSSLRYLSDKLQLLNLMAELDPSWGSHRYRGDWAYLDQILISPELQEEISTYGVQRADFLLEEDSKYPGKKPQRSFRGDFYQGGFSDHLPIFLILN